MRRVLRAAALLAATAVAATALSTVALPSQAADAPRGAGTTVTVQDGRFRGLAVSVSQTRNLINQVVTVSWTGATTTQPTSGRFGEHYLQIMQCWGDDPAGPRREQCQYGGRFGVDQRGGSFTASRQVSYGTLVDPLETYQQAPGSAAPAYVPFESVTGKRSAGGASEFFDASTTNELPFGRTRADGTGSELFEVQTAREAPGLGCGVRTATATARGCFLVVVPRDDREVDGTPRKGGGEGDLESSPLSASNWQHRIVVPLQFEPLGRTCPQQSERRLLGQELVTELVTRWQPALCADGGATYGFTQVTDAFARSTAASPDPALVMTSTPVDPAAVDPTRPLVYAPVAVQGLAVAFLVERNPLQRAPAEVQRRSGTQVLDMRLTPRLVAKLLTQSYRNATPEENPAVAGNPFTLSTDREFLELNPEFGDLLHSQLSDAVVAVGQSDAAALLWRWVDGDPEARAWLDGAPDPYGTVVHPAYRGLVLPVEDFPKKDEHCRRFADGRVPLCALERRPYAADLNDAGRSAARGDNLSRQTYDGISTPPQWRASGPQPTGQRGVLAVTDTATAERYGLAVAKLRNRAGRFVAPDEAGLTAGLAAMQDSAVPGVKVADPLTTSAAAYPLTTVSYAVTAPAALDEAAGRDYAAFLEHAAGPGQVPGITPGTLPGGYVPLDAELRAQTAAAARTVRETAGVPVAPPSAPADGPAGPPAALLRDVAPLALGTGTSSASSLFTTAAGTAAEGGALDTGLEPAVAAAGPAPEVALRASGGTTPGSPTGAARYWLPALLLVGVVAGLVGPALTRFRPDPA